MSGFGPSPVYPGALALDPTKHVNYVEGMVLGSTDLRQEFAYHAQRPQWLVRDLVGYGTVWGLSVSQRIGARGPEVVVSSGVGLSPRGQFIRVAPAQCAPLDDWLAGRAADVNARKQGPGPSVFTLPLYVVLGYKSCDSDPVPIAGEPCRTEDDSVAPSRTGDGFQLELAFDPPPQIEDEEAAVREFFAWLQSHITVTGGGAASLTIPQYLDAIRAAAAAAAAAVTSPPGSGPRLTDTSPPVMLSVPGAQLASYLRAVFRLWATELRPAWRPNWLGDKHGWAGDEPLASPEHGNRIVLARLTLSIEPPGLGSTAWTVSSGAPIAIADDLRPYVLPLRFVQEWLFAQGGGGGGGGGPAGPLVVAAGAINANGSATARSVLGGLKVAAPAAATATATQLTVAFAGYAAPPATGGPQYVVKALPWPGTALTNLTVAFAGFAAGGFVLAVSKNGAPLAAAELDALQLIVEVSQYP